MSQVLQLTDRNFREEVFQSEVPVIVEFSASWCVPSQQEKPVLEELAGKYSGKLKVGELNVDQNPRVASKCQIMGCPTFILLHLGKEVQRWVGARSKEQLSQIVSQAL